MPYVYLLRCADGTYYTGWTTDLAARLAAHNAGRGSRYTRGRRPASLAYWEEFATETEARKREPRLRRLSHDEKAALPQMGVLANPTGAGRPDRGKRDSGSGKK